MAKRSLAEPLSQLESDIIDTLIAGHKEWRPDLNYPESHSDMQGAVRGLLQMFKVERRSIPFKLEYQNDIMCYECLSGSIPSSVFPVCKAKNCPHIRSAYLFKKDDKAA